MNAGFQSVYGCTVQVLSTEQEGLTHLAPGYMLMLDVDVRHAEVVLSHEDAATLVSYLTPPKTISHAKMRDLKFVADFAFLRGRGTDSNRMEDALRAVLADLGYTITP